MTTTRVCEVLSKSNVYNNRKFDISFFDINDTNVNLNDIIDYIRTTYYDISDLNLVLNVIKSNDTQGNHTNFYINSEAIQDMIDDNQYPISDKSTIIGFTKYDEYFIAGDSLGMNKLEINWDKTTKAMVVRYASMDNVYRINGDDVEDESTTYFYIENTSNQSGTVSIAKKNDSGGDASTAPTITVYYSPNQTNWTLMGSTSTTAITANIAAKSRLYLKATSRGWGKANTLASPYSFNYIACNRTFDIGGNIMSLLAGDGFASVTSLSNYNSNTFQFLFANDTTLVHSDKLILPNDTKHHCYNFMFAYCTSLTTTPVLPATTIRRNSYQYMFHNCTSLTTAPNLPATTIADVYAYNSMFRGCSSLVNVPAILPATTLKNYCYRYMFQGCTALRKGPALPATALTTSCYGYMFNGCTSLEKVVIYANNISASGCLTNWLSGVPATGDFYNLGTATYPTGVSGIPSGWTEHHSL